MAWTIAQAIYGSAEIYALHIMAWTITQNKEVCAVIYAIDSL